MTTVNSILTTYNPSFLAIPAYHILSMLPHVYALSVATQGRPSTWDNRNPRSSSIKPALKERLSADQFALWERLEACHANGMENLPVFAAAVIVGNMAGLKDMGKFAGTFLALRVLYTVVYASSRTQGLSAVRSLVWAGSVGLCWRVFWRAAGVFGNKVGGL